MPKFIDKLKEELVHTTDTLWQNEVQANLTVARILIITSTLALMALVAERLGLLGFGGSNDAGFILIQSFIELVVAAAICLYFKGEKRWLKILMLLVYCFACARIESVLTSSVTLLMIFPLVLSIRYYSRPVTVFTAVVIALISGLADYSAIYLGNGRMDLNYIRFFEGAAINLNGQTLRKAIYENPAIIDMAASWRTYFLSFFLPKLAMFVMVSLVCAEIAKKGREAIFAQQAETQKTERIATELNLASNIQTNMLPNIFPAFPERKEFDIFATMDPAKEVGGDFYDFYMIDENHLALVIADVSGKGIPAAMFMMASKIMISNISTFGAHDPALILEKTNQQITATNKSDMFVTVWLGIIDLATGKMTCANAGHEYPCLKQNNQFTLLKDKHGLVVGGIENSKYKNYEIDLQEGDSLFVYTDGVAEATNSNNELFGTDRLLEVLNKDPNISPEKMIGNVRTAIDEFVLDAPQFDDITMLAFKYNGVKNMHELNIEATIENVPIVTAFVDDKLEKLDCPIKVQTQIDIAIDELFSNIAKYAYHPEIGPATVKVEVEEDPMAVVITFIDQGVPYDPLANEDPDISLGVDDREIGGLGIYLVKKTMDDVAYEYKDGQNILKIKKEFK